MPLSEKLKNEVLRKADRIKNRQIHWRRHLHQYPELSMQEFRTTAFLKKTIRQLGLKAVPIKLPVGLIAEIKGRQPGKTVALRTDIDALPVMENTTLPFKSKTAGFMHACGHDAHMAILLGTAAVLKEFQDKIRGTVRFIFQPAEELPPGGARPMIQAGALKSVSMIFALHVDPLLQTGRISIRDGVTMGSVTDFDLVVHGKGGHAARPHDAVDAIAAAAEVVESIQKVVSREINPIYPAVITFGRIEGGTARNTICDRVTLTATARALSPSVAANLKRLVKRTASAVCRAHGARLEMKIVADYPILSNYPAANKLLADNFKMLFPKNRIELTPLVLGGEDFACYLQKTPGAMFRLGTRNKKMKADKPWHSPQFIVDEGAMYYGTALFAATVLDYLKGEA